MNESVIRLIAADANGQISIHDYDTVSKVTKLVSEGIDYNIPQNKTSVDEPWNFNKISGIEMDDHEISCFFMIVVRNSKKGCCSGFDNITTSLLPRKKSIRFRHLLSSNQNVLYLVEMVVSNSYSKLRNHCTPYH